MHIYDHDRQSIHDYGVALVANEDIPREDHADREKRDQVCPRDDIREKEYGADTRKENCS